MNKAASPDKGFVAFLSSCVGRLGSESPASVISSDRYLMADLFDLVHPVLEDDSFACGYDRCGAKFKRREGLGPVFCPFCPLHEKMAESGMPNCVSMVGYVYVSDHCHACQTACDVDHMWDVVFGPLTGFVLCDACLKKQRDWGKPIEVVTHEAQLLLLQRIRILRERELEGSE